MSERARLDRDGTIHVEGAPDARIVSWNPPLLVLERAGELRRVFLSPGRDGGWLGVDGKSWPVPRSGGSTTTSGAAMAPAGNLTAPMPGKVLELLVAEGDRVTAGQRLLVLEAMKMETPLRAPVAGTIRAVHVRVGASVDPGQVLVEMDPDDGDAQDGAAP